MYLIMECRELGDQWECDADRSPVTLTEDWKQWYNETKPFYPFEIYEFVDNKFSCIKDYTTSIEKGMAFVYYTQNDSPVVIEKFPNRTRNSQVPAHIMKRAKAGDDYENDLECWGVMSWFENDVMYGYAEYYNNDICNPF